MKVIIVLFIALALGLGESKHHLGFGSLMNRLKRADPSPKIVGGHNAEVGEFPYQVSLQLRGLLPLGHYCGGCILSSTVILTAGHCVTEIGQYPLTHTEVVAGIINLKNEGPNMQKSKVAKTIVHPKYEGKVNPYDIAIHILEEPLTLNEYVNIVKLPVQGEDATKDNVILSGWGSTSDTQIPSYPDNLQTADFTLLSYEDCAAIFQEMEGTSDPLDELSNVCTADTNGGLSACSGDSGGPLVSAGDVPVLVGVVSWGMIPCGHKGPSVYTRVSSFVDFIKENAGDLLH